MQATRQVFQPFRTVSGNDERGQRTAQPPRLSPGQRVNDPSDSVPLECYDKRISIELTPNTTAPAPANSRQFANLGGWLAYPLSTNVKQAGLAAANTSNVFITNGTEFDSAAVEAGSSTILSGFARDRTFVARKLRITAESNTDANIERIVKTSKLTLVRKVPNQSAQGVSLFSNEILVLQYDPSRCAYNEKSKDYTINLDDQPLVIDKNQHLIAEYTTPQGGGVVGDKLIIEIDQWCESQDLDTLISAPPTPGRPDGPPCG